MIKQKAVTSAYDYMTMKEADINKAIVSIKNRGAKWDADVQAVGLACMMQVKSHNNTTPMNALVLAMPKGARTTALQLWMLAHGGVSLNMDKKAKAIQPLAWDKDKPVDIAAAMAQPWYDIKTEPTPAQMLDVEKAVDALIKRIAAAPGVNNPELAKRLVALRSDALKASNAVSAGPVMPALPNQMN